MSVSASDAAASNSTSRARSARARPLRILVTGSEGLIGTSLVARLRAIGHRVSSLDVRASDAASRGDTRESATLCRLLEDLTRLIDDLRKLGRGPAVSVSSSEVR